MIAKNGAWVGLMVLLLFPAGVDAQTVAQSFDQLQGLLELGEQVVITDETGRETQGRVANVSASSLIILNGAAGRQTFDEPTIRRIEHRDSLRNGTIIGLVIGIGLTALFDAGYCRFDCEGAAASYLFSGGLGAAAGLGIDALIGGNRVLYQSPTQTRGLTFSTVLGPRQRGILASIRF